MKNNCLIIRYLYLAVLKYNLNPMQLGMCPDTREKISNDLGIHWGRREFEDRVLRFVQKYSIILGRSGDEKKTNFKKGRFSKIN